MNEDDGRYDDIIGLPHPTSRKHKRMPVIGRAAQFAPFAALTRRISAPQNGFVSPLMLQPVLGHSPPPPSPRHLVTVSRRAAAASAPRRKTPPTLARTT